MHAEVNTHEDEFFLVWEGVFRVEFRDRIVELKRVKAFLCRAGSSTGLAPMKQRACLSSNPPKP